MTVMTCKSFFDDLRHCSHSRPITHRHHSSDSVLRLWYRCIFYSVCMICWNKSYIDQYLLDCVVMSITGRTEVTACGDLLFSVWPGFCSVLMTSYLRKDRQAAGVLNYTIWGRLILCACSNWENTGFSPFDAVLTMAEHLPWVEVEGASRFKRRWRLGETNCLFVGSVLFTGSLLHYVGEGQVNILWAVVKATPHVHVCIHTGQAEPNKGLKRLKELARE